MCQGRFGGRSDEFIIWVYGDDAVSRFNGVVRGMTKKKRKQFLEEGKLPLPVKAAIYQRDGYKTVVFDLVEES